MSGLNVAILTAATLAASLVATYVVMRMLSYRAILDHPNARSSHSEPTPRGGGLAVVPILIVAWLIAIPLGAAPEVTIICAIAAAALAALSWMDDLSGLSPQVRLAGHTVAIATALTTLPTGFNPFTGLVPWPGDLIITALAWLWFVNLFNFMDGIDGIAATETITIGAGGALVASINGSDEGLVPLGLTAAAAALGFLWWNRPPARVFLGDVGSVPLGFLLGGFLLFLANKGYWTAALILPLYYIADATLTIFGRSMRGERIWQAHRLHAYQLAVDAGRSHGAVICRIAMVNVLLIALAVLSTIDPVWAMPSLACAAIAVGVVLLWMRHPPGHNSPTAP